MINLCFFQWTGDGKIETLSLVKDSESFGFNIAGGGTVSPNTYSDNIILKKLNDVNILLLKLLETSLFNTAHHTQVHTW